MERRPEFDGVPRRARSHAGRGNSPRSEAAGKIDPHLSISAMRWEVSAARPSPVVARRIGDAMAMRCWNWPNGIQWIRWPAGWTAVIPKSTSEANQMREEITRSMRSKRSPARCFGRRRPRAGARPERAPPRQHGDDWIIGLPARPHGRTGRCPAGDASMILSDLLRLSASDPAHLASARVRLAPRFPSPYARHAPMVTMRGPAGFHEEHGHGRPVQPWTISVRSHT